MRIFVALAVLLMIYKVYSAPSFTCLANDTISIVVNQTANPELANKFVTVLDTSDCSGIDSVQLMNDTTDAILQKVNVTCFNFTLGTSFGIRFLENKTLNKPGDVTYNLTCQIAENVTQPNNVTIDGRASTASFDATYQPNVIHKFGVTTAAVSDPLTITAELDSASARDVKIALISLLYRIVDSNVEAYLVSDRCPDNSLVPVNLTGDPDNTAPNKVTTEFIAFLLNTDITRTAALVELVFVYGFCANDNTTFCFVDNDCTDGTDRIGRKRRQIVDVDIVTTEKRERLIIFPSEQGKNNYVKKALEEAGLSTNPTVNEPKKGEICVNKTVSFVLLALQLSVMAICLISSAIIFFNEKQNHKDKLVGYNNKAF